MFDLWLLKSKNDWHAFLIYLMFILTIILAWNNIKSGFVAWNEWYLGIRMEFFDLFQQK